MKAFWKTTSVIARVGAGMGVALLVSLAACQKNESAGTAGGGEPAGAAAVSPAAGGASIAAPASKAPFGFLHSPEEGATVKSGAWAYGWALDDSGIAQVTVASDMGSTSPVALGQPFPGVAQSYPGYPDADKAGFGFPIPKIDSGIHTLVITLVAKDGGKTEIRRQVRVP